MKKSKVAVAILLVISVVVFVYVREGKEPKNHIQNTIQSGGIHTVDPKSINTDAGGSY